MSYYRDLRQYIETLERHEKLFRIKREIRRETELHPMVRWQFRGLGEWASADAPPTLPLPPSAGSWRPTRFLRSASRPTSTPSATCSGA